MKNDKRQKWNYDEKYFDKIDSYEKAYWLGFITADGYIMDNRKTDNKSKSTGLRIRLSEEDKEHLEKLNESIQYNKPISIVKNYGIYENCKDLAEFSLYSGYLVDRLYDLGLTSGNKSCNEKPPCLDNNLLIKNFILGLFDGDGTISIGQRLVEWSIVSSLEMTTFIKDFLEKETGIKFNKIIPNGNGKNLYRVRTCSKKSIKILYEYFYNNECSKMYLDRKYNKMKSV